MNAEASNPPEHATPGSGSLPAPQKIALIADDEAPICHVLSQVVKAFGFRVVTAANGEEAVRLVGESTQKFSVAFLDVAMPNLDGVATFRVLRRLSADTLLVLMSGYPRPDVMQELEDLKPVFLLKPFRRADVEAVLAPLQTTE